MVCTQCGRNEGDRHLDYWCYPCSHNLLGDANAELRRQLVDARNENDALRKRWKPLVEFMACTLTFDKEKSLAQIAIDAIVKYEAELFLLREAVEWFEGVDEVLAAYSVYKAERDNPLPATDTKGEKT